MGILEVTLKVGVTLVVLVGIVYGFRFIAWTWSSQIDMKETFSRFLKKAAPNPEMIATRDPNKIYQGGTPVGDVTGEIISRSDDVVFRELTNTEALDRSMPFEHRREKYRIVHVGSMAGLHITMSNTSTEQKRGVLKDVVCAIVR